jgi:DNA/RNA-binding domain of Phe-tRNA-synthetase-like protein
MLTLWIERHPLLRAGAFETRFPAPLAEIPVGPGLADLLRIDATAPVERSEEIRTAIRDMLRLGGYKPTGRGKPASEYLVRATREGHLSSINVAVDACNAVSLHSGLPISVIDLDRAVAPFRLAIADPGARYVFNASGQEIDLGGLLCVFDADGPCANAVRDSQRTKTHAGTRSTLSVVWGCTGFEDRLRAALDWYRHLLEATGATIEPIATRIDS